MEDCNHADGTPAASTRREQLHRDVLPRGLPGSAIERSVARSRCDLSKHNGVPGTPRGALFPAGSGEVSVTDRRMHNVAGIHRR